LKNIFTTRKRIIIAGVAAGAVVLGTGGAAYAYFTTSGNGTGNATVASAAGAWSVTGGSGTTALTPGGSENLIFTVTNSGSQVVNLGQVAASIPATGGDVLKNDGSGHWVEATGCDASWFQTGTIVVDGGLNQSIAVGGHTTVTVPVAMSNPATNQDACQGILGPQVTLQITQGDAPPAQG
jgi:hypothetical protein